MWNVNERRDLGVKKEKEALRISKPGFAMKLL
jgi:hypothetical protein